MSIIHDPSSGVARADDLAQLGERMRGLVTASKAAGNAAGVPDRPGGGRLVV